MRRLIAVLAAMAALGAGAGGLALAQDGSEVGPDNFKANGNGTVTDTTTGEVWEQNTSPALVLADAPAYCATLRLAGKADWRVPNIYELERLVVYPTPNNYPPLTASSPLFSFDPGTGSSRVLWSSTASAPINSGTEWAVEFTPGFTYTFPPEYGYIGVRCVRGRVRPGRSVDGLG